MTERRPTNGSGANDFWALYVEVGLNRVNELADDDRGKRIQHLFRLAQSKGLSQTETESLANWTRKQIESQYPKADRPRGLYREIRAAIKDARPEQKDADTWSAQGSALTFTSPEPWPENVDGEALFADLIATIRKFVVVSDQQYVAMALWVINSHVFEVLTALGFPFNYLPILAIVSPVKRCGKSRLLELLQALCPRPLRSANASSAALFRVIESSHPTLLIDEFDSLPDVQQSEIRNILNASFERGQPVLRMCGDGPNAEARGFNVFTPVAVAAIKCLPDTILDRSIVITMDRKPPDVEVSKFRGAARKALHDLSRKVARWTLENADKLRQVEPPKALHDRAADIWEPLLVIADRMSEQVKIASESAAVMLVMGDVRQEGSLDMELVHDLRAIAEVWSASAETVQQSDDSDYVAPKELVNQLLALEGRPWPDIGKNGLTTHYLGRMLGGFGLQSKTRWLGKAKTGRFYEKKDIAAVVTRYSESENPSSVDDSDAEGNGAIRSANPEKICNPVMKYEEALKMKYEEALKTSLMRITESAKRPVMQSVMTNSGDVSRFITKCSDSETCNEYETSHENPKK